jgi:hypothetical protein
MLNTKDLEREFQELLTLKDEYTDLQEQLSDAEEDEDEDEILRLEDEIANHEFDDDAHRQLIEISELKESMGSSSWKSNTELINDDDFEEFCQDYVIDNYQIPTWLHNHIDWVSVAVEMCADYSSVEFRGATWLYR